MVMMMMVATIVTGHDRHAHRTRWFVLQPFRQAPVDNDNERKVLSDVSGVRYARAFYCQKFRALKIL